MTLKQEIKRQAIFIAAHHDYAKGLNARAFFKVHDHATGEDLVQDTFMKMWKYLAKGGKIDMMKAFLYHVLNHLIVDEYRRKKNTTFSLDTLLEKGFEPSDENSGQLSHFLDGKAALLLIKKLPHMYKKVMHLRYVEDLSIREISAITGQSKNTVAVQAHRGLAKLKSLYDRA